MNEQEVAQAVLQSQTRFSHPEWRRHCSNLTRELLSKPLQDFMNFQAVRETMFVGNAEYTFDEFDEMNTAGIKLDDLIDCDVFSHTHQHPKWTTTGNTIHHRYHLYMLEREQRQLAESLNKILELGGGYGNMARLIHRMGFDGEYYIEDLPEFQILQKYYLSYHGVPSSWTPDLTEHYDLFIATWSLSELPLEDRHPYEHLNADCFLISYGPNYCDIDNAAYFSKFVEYYPQHIWEHVEAPHLPNQYYLIGALR